MVWLQVLSSDEEDEEEDEDTFTLSDDSDDDAFPIKKEPKQEDEKPEEVQPAEDSEGRMWYQRLILSDNSFYCSRNV